MRRRDQNFPDNGFEAWGGYMHAKVAKLEEQFDKRTDEEKESNLFQGIGIFVNGYTKPSAEELKIIMSKHGGVYHTYQRSDDYVIASNLPDFKVKKLTTTKIVKPEWISDSLASNSLLDYKQYLLYSKHTRTQPRLEFNAGVPQKSYPSPSDCTEIENTCKDCSQKTNEIIEEQTVNKRELKNVPSLEVPVTSLEIHPSDFLTWNTPNIPSENDTVATENELKPLPNATNSGSNATKTAVDPNFLSEFYSNSRLHHISQLGATFKQYVNDLRDASDFVFPARTELKQAIDNTKCSIEPEINLSDFQGGKLIMHIDMDCFFVSVGLRQRPEFQGVPVAVTHARGRRAGGGGGSRSGVDRQTEFHLYRQRNAKALAKATGLSEDEIQQGSTFKTRVDDLDEDEGFGSMSEIASCSYEARAKGVRNGMFVGAALRLCPDLKTIPYDFDGYKEVAYTLYNTIAQYTLDVEAVSCDELYCDCTELVTSLCVCPARLATALRCQIRDKTGCPCSTGFGANRLQARLATKRAKPDGQFFLTSQLVDAFMMDVKVGDLPGVGRQLLQRISTLCSGTTDATCEMLRPFSLATLQHQLGAAAGRMLFHYCRGDDERPLTFVTVRKSVSADVNYGIRLESEEQLDRFLRQLCSEVHERLQRTRMSAKSVTLKVMVRAEDAPVETAKYMGHGYCDTINKSSTLPAATDRADVITGEVLQLCRKLKLDPKEVRGVGIQLTKLESVKKQNSNALKAFFQQATNKVNDFNKDIVKQAANEAADVKKDSLDNEKKNSDNKLDYQEQKKNLSSWITKTPPKKTDTTRVTPGKMTPVKLLIQSPTLLKRSPARTPQKSPPKKKTLGLTGRRRGRPPKNATITVPARPASTSIMSKFLAGERSRNEIETLDPEFLAALPDDIRQEILEHYCPVIVPKELSRPATPTSVVREHAVCVTPTVLRPAATDIGINTAAHVENYKTVLKLRQDSKLDESSKSRSLELPWQQTREVLRSWFNVPSVPPPCDVELISSCMQSMVIARNIDKLIGLISFMRRKTQEMEDNSWSNVYDHIVEGIQQTMIAVYGKPLLLP